MLRSSLGHMLVLGHSFLWLVLIPEISALFTRKGSEGIRAAVKYFVLVAAQVVAPLKTALLFLFSLALKSSSSPP